MDLKILLCQAVDRIRAWEGSWGAFEDHAALAVDEDRLAEVFDDYLDRLGGNYPFFHPHYAGQMLKPPHPAAVAGYLAAQLINPNNHALDGGPPTARMEKEVVRAFAAMFHFPDETLGHLTGGGTIANLEALWVARELHPDRSVAFGTEAHYTHGRMSRVLGLRTEEIPADDHGRLDLEALEATLRSGRIGTVVATAGTTGVGAVDPIADVISLCRRYGVRVHVDAAYGGFFTVLARADASPMSADVRRHFRAIAEADSVVIDPHKHGLQPYGCGAILFRDPSVGKFYRHDSPYTYFTSDDLHLGEISLECSRPGAAAGALWLTLQLFPLKPDAGLGPIVAAGVRSAKRWAAMIEREKGLSLYLEPELDIVTFFPVPDPFSISGIDAASEQIFSRGMNDPHDPLFLSLYRVEKERLAARAAGLARDRDHARILRSVLMKPTHEHALDAIHARVIALAGAK